MTIFNNDLINTLTHLPPDSDLALIRQDRSAATLNTQAAYSEIFSVPSTQFPIDVRYGFAHQVAKLTGSQTLADFYFQQAPALKIENLSPALQAAAEYLQILTLSPKDTQFSLIETLITQGWENSDIVLLAQLITFVTYQARLVEGIELLTTSKNDPRNVAKIVAGKWNHQPFTRQGRPSPTAFTQDNLGWEAWITARKAETLSDEETQVMKKFGQLTSEYFLLLAHQSKILEIRTLIDRGVFYTAGGLPRWEREFAAAAVSKVNGCIYCASVHARKASQYAKERRSDVDKLLATPTGEILADGFDDRLLAITDLVASLSATPIQATISQVATLRQLGLSELELLDLIQSTAFFSWANRLMLSLGEPFEIMEDKE
ncbi:MULTISPECIES: CMD domain-containing protein [Providencia]|uniref:CMD domain-containing protein n=1 Tax=Providencia TaxID=586 RepID=UPI00197D22CE|nr:MULTISPECIES: peroxidase-related enzyme [Providencia]MBN4863621.1 peroxidase-related enzyme [Providencia stuartii]MBN4872943.1 peroxidase-related enzyme [Providencia stuartii]MBN4877936.1 peroxidase-related enzyme [Providencia stuartii]MBN4882144.1 peroxidase-related enzyme [Providencia stuartii]